MCRNVRGLLVCTLILLTTTSVCSVSAGASRKTISKPDEPPTIPVGLDAYRQWDRWPYQRIGARAYMRSTYDRRGGNEGADASHFLYQLARRLQRLAGRRPARAFSTSPATITGTAARGTTRSMAWTTSSGRPAPPTRSMPRRLQGNGLHPGGAVPESADLDMVHDQGGGSDVGAAAVRADVSHGLFAHPLWHRLLHLSPLRSQCAALAADPVVGRQDAAGEGRAGPAESRGHGPGAACRTRRRATTSV